MWSSFLRKDDCGKYLVKGKIMYAAFTVFRIHDRVEWNAYESIKDMWG